MLKITRTADDESGPLVKLEGKLLRPWLDELAQACHRHAVGETRVRFDLSAVSYVDEAGARLLRALLDQGVRVAAVSGFVAELLRGEKR